MNYIVIMLCLTKLIIFSCFNNPVVNNYNKVHDFYYKKCGHFKEILP